MTMSRLVLNTLNASFIISRLPCSTMTRQLALLNLSALRRNPSLFLFTESGISARIGTLNSPKSSFPLTVVSSMRIRKITAKGIPHPSTRAARRSISLFGATGFGDPFGFMIRRVLPTFTRAASSFSSLFSRRKT